MFISMLHRTAKKEIYDLAVYHIDNVINVYVYLSLLSSLSHLAGRRMFIASFISSCTPRLQSHRKTEEEKKAEPLIDVSHSTLSPSSSCCCYEEKENGGGKTAWLAATNARTGTRDGARIDALLKKASSTSLYLSTRQQNIARGGGKTKLYAKKAAAAAKEEGRGSGGSTRTRRKYIYKIFGCGLKKKKSCGENGSGVHRLLSTR